MRSADLNLSDHVILTQRGLLNEAQRQQKQAEVDEVKLKARIHYNRKLQRQEKQRRQKERELSDSLQERVKLRNQATQHMLSSLLILPDLMAETQAEVAQLREIELRAPKTARARLTSDKKAIVSAQRTVEKAEEAQKHEELAAIVAHNTARAALARDTIRTGIAASRSRSMETRKVTVKEQKEKMVTDLQHAAELTEFEQSYKRDLCQSVRDSRSASARFTASQALRFDRSQRDLSDELLRTQTSIARTTLQSSNLLDTLAAEEKALAHERKLTTDHRQVIDAKTTRAIRCIETPDSLLEEMQLSVKQL